jgi:hypothetical protein
MDVLVPFADLKNYGITFCKDRIRVLVKKGLFPKPVRVGAYRIAWRRSDLEAWIAALPTTDEKPRPGGPRGVVKARAEKQARSGRE